MKQKLLKSLLAVALLFAGGNVLAQIETIGANDFSTGWWSAFSSTYSLEGYGKYHFQFTTTNVNDGSAWKTWLLVATDGNDSHGGGGTEYFVWRGDNYAWGQGTDSNAVPDKLVCSTNYSIVNPTGAGLQAATNGASVDMVITRESNNIYATATVTPSNGENEFTMDFSFLYGTATSANVGLFLTVENAQVVLNTAEQTASWSTVWTTDFSSAPSGMTYSISAGSCNITNGYLWYKNDAGSGNRTQTASFTDSKFNVDTNWIMEFDWNCGQSNSQSSDVTFATNNGNAFTLSWKNNGNGQVTVTDATSTSLSTTLPVAGYNIGSISTWSHVVVKGDKDNGVYLIITNGTTTYVDNQLVTSTFGYPVSFNGTLGKSVAAMGMDNIVFRTPTVSGYVAPPTSTISGAYNTDRKFTLECLTPDVTIYYATSDLAIGDPGWIEYTSEAQTSATTIYAYAKDGSNNTSEKMNFATGAGTIVNLVAATVTHSGNGKYTIANSQSSVLGTPTATVHYQLDGGAEQTSTSTSFDVNVAADGTLTYWLTADGYGDVAEQDETVYGPRFYDVTTTINFKTSNTNEWATKGDEVTITGDTHTYYQYKDQSDNILADGLLATTFDGNSGTSWRIQRYYGGTKPYAATEYIALKGLTAGQYVQIECTGAPAIVSNLTAVPASTYTGTYTYTATADGDVIVSIGTSVVLETIKLCSMVLPVSISALGWSTLYTPYALDFSSLSGSFTAYTATVAGSTITLNPVTEVPANTGVVLNGDEGSYNIPVITSSAEEQGALTGNAAAATAYDAFDGYTLYALAQAEDYPTHQVQFRPVTEGSIAAGKAFLKIANGSLVKAFDIDIAGADAINDVRSKMEEGRSEIFNLAGQRMNRLQKGVNIVNGKKILVK